MAKKKYYQGRQDRRDESRGMRDYYSGIEGRKRMEREGSMMISEDRGEVANLPQGVMMKEYPKCPYQHYNLDDGLMGIQVQERDDSRMAKKDKYPEKY